MSDVAMPHKGPYRPKPGQRRQIGTVSVTNLPSGDELASQVQADDPTGERVDRYSLFTPDQIEDETKNVRLDISFGDVAKVRDQAEMIIACMHEIIKKTREHKIGSIRQRIEARAEADSLRRVMARFNGKCPHGDRYVPKSQR